MMKMSANSFRSPVIIGVVTARAWERLRPGACGPRPSVGGTRRACHVLKRGEPGLLPKWRARCAPSGRGPWKRLRAEEQLRFLPSSASTAFKKPWALADPRSVLRCWTDGEQCLAPPRPRPRPPAQA